VKPLHKRLDSLKLIQDEDIEILDRLHRKTADYPAGCIVQREKAPIEWTRIIVSGWAIRFRTTADGHRQIINFLLPGDSIGLYGALFPQSDSGVETVTDAKLAEFASTELMEVFRKSARLGAALCWIGGQDERFRSAARMNASWNSRSCASVHSMPLPASRTCSSNSSCAFSGPASRRPMH